MSHPCHPGKFSIKTLAVSGVAVALALSLTACQGGSSAKNPAAGTDKVTAADEITLADAYELGGYNPTNGYAALGVSPIYEGLLGLESKDPHKLPELRPVLATTLPTSNADKTEWTVEVRDGVKFSDGSDFNAQDVVANYKEAMNPATASEIGASFDMVDQINADGNKVTFKLKYPYPDFPSRLLLGLAPGEYMKGGLASESPLNTKPVGTGPYVLETLDSQKAVWIANPKYWGKAPQVKKLTTVYVPDDAARVARIRTKEFDGSIIPPALANSLKDLPDYQVVYADSADWRGISFPGNNAFCADLQARIAMNEAVNRPEIIKKVLFGAGKPAYTPVSGVYEAYVPEAQFKFDLEGAKKRLDQAGWKVGADGIREKDGQRAAFTLAYTSNDTVRRDLSVAFAAAMKPLGVDVKLEGTTWDALDGRLDKVGILLGGGDKPYSIDTQVYSILHTREANTSQYDNPGNYGSPEMDKILEQARKSGDESERVKLYQQAQKQYLEAPNHVFLAFLQHTYVTRDAGWKTGNLTVEPHSHGVNWGPWWNLGQWEK